MPIIILFLFLTLANNPLLVKVAFTFQVLLVASYDLKQTTFSIILELGEKGSERAQLGGKLKVRLSKWLADDRQVEVFSGIESNGESEFVSTSHLWAGLALLDNSNELYSLMPAKFSKASLSVSSSSLEEGTVKVFVNYMSHIDYQQRRAFSGPIETLVQSKVSEEKRAEELSGELDGCSSSW